MSPSLTSIGTMRMTEVAFGSKLTLPMPAAASCSGFRSGVMREKSGGADTGLSPVEAKPALSAGLSLSPWLEMAKPKMTGLPFTMSANKRVAVGQRHAGRHAARPLQKVADGRIADDLRRRQPVGLGEQHVEHDGAGAEARPAVRQARPAGCAATATGRRS